MKTIANQGSQPAVRPDPTCSLRLGLAGPRATFGLAKDVAGVMPCNNTTVKPWLNLKLNTSVNGEPDGWTITASNHARTDHGDNTLASSPCAREAKEHLRQQEHQCIRERATHG